VPQLGECAVLAVAHRDHVVRAQEDHDLAGAHDLAGGGQLVVLHVGRRLQHHEERVVVALELGPLVGVDGVLHRERVQVVLPGDRGQLVLGGLEEPQPDVAVSVGRHAQCFARGHRFLSHTVDVDGAVDDGADAVAAPCLPRLPPGRPRARVRRLRGAGGRVGRRPVG